MTQSESSPANRPATRRELFAWALYDWANSAYSTLSITVLMFYIKDVAVSPDSQVARHMVWAAGQAGFDLGPENCGAVVWAWGISLSMLVAALLSPIVGAMADARANKRRWLAVTALSGAAAALLLAIVPPHLSWPIVGLFFLAHLCFELSFGFYNGFLPELATEETMDRISAWGFACGYVGGGIALGLGFMVFTFGDRVGITDPVQQLRAGLLIMGLWWGLFTLPTLIVLRDRAAPRVARMPLHRATREALGEVRATLSNIRSYRTLALFLLGFLFFNDGIQTVISQSPVFAETVLGFEPSELLTVILAFQFICLPGAMVVGHVSQKFGQKATLMVCLAIWVVALSAAFFIQTKLQFWLLSVALGLVMGGSQSVSRAIMGVMTPPRRTAEFFGFFNFSGRATSWLGTFIFGLVMAGTGNARLAIVSLLVLFVVGWALTARVNVAQGRRDAQTAPGRDSGR